MLDPGVAVVNGGVTGGEAITTDEPDVMVLKFTSISGAPWVEAAQRNAAEATANRERSVRGFFMGGWCC